MNRFKRLLRPLLIVLGVLCAVVILGFVERSSEHAPITDLRVLVDGAAGMHFIDEDAVRREVLDQGVAVMGAPMGEVDMPRIEDALRNIPCVAEAEAYRTLDGVLHVKVRQREPIVRVLNNDGSSFYIDKDGWTMPTDPDYTARVLVVTGALNEPGARDGVYAVHADDSLRAVQLSDDIHRLALYISTRKGSPSPIGAAMTGWTCATRTRSCAPNEQPPNTPHRPWTTTKTSSRALI